MSENLPLLSSYFISYFIFFLWFGVLLFLGFLTERIWARILPGMKYRLFVAPGVIVHELSHALACLLFLAPVQKISFFSREGGFVQHGRSRLGFLGNALIAMAPIFGITLFLWLLVYWFGYALEVKATDFSSADFWPNVSWLFESAWGLIKINASSGLFWLFIYLAVSSVSALAPSKKDFQNALGGLMFLFFVGLIIFYAGFGSHFLIDLISRYLGYVISLGIIWQGLALIIGLPVCFIRKLLK